MNILDENIPKNQRQLLESWRISVRQIGVNAGSTGMKVGNIIRVSSAGVACWRLHTPEEIHFKW